MNKKLTIFSLLLMLMLPVTASAEDAADPLEGFNRKVHAFNDVADKYFLKPLAKSYEAVTPRILRRGIKNVFTNLDNINNIASNLLQGKPGAAATDTARFLFNVSLGVGGLFDPATGMGLPQSEEDWGQTLGAWGVGPGPYLVLPFLGPSNFRDGITRPLNTAMDPVRYHDPVDHRNTAMGVRLLQQRVDLFAAEAAIFGDEYVFIRDAYLQRREYLVLDGKLPLEEDEFGF